MILLQPSMVAGLEGPSPDPAAVLAALQSAIELEHATIPPYLYALYSLDPGKNPEIAAIIESVVVEEMLHMTLAANLLNALGGEPDIDRSDFIPTYPGPLPGGVESSLEVHLAPFSMSGPINQLEAFLEIEAPAADAPEGALTIGEFYDKIKQAITALGDGAFVDPKPHNQIGPDLLDEAVVVTDVASAHAAIQTIVDQGEGTATSPFEVVGGGYAHYYRFMEVRNWRLLVPEPDHQFAYAGAPVPFDPTGVYAAPVDPGGYPAGSPQAFANDNFNYTYTSLLRALDALFNGDASEAQLNRTIGLMMSLKGQAKAMMSGIPDPSMLIGPSFQYQPVNPASNP